MRGLFLAGLAALLCCAACSSDGDEKLDTRPAPKSDTVRVSTYDGELSRYGVNVHPVDQMDSYIDEDAHAVVLGAVIFQTDGAIAIHDEEFVAKGSLLATRHPYPHTPYYTVYAIKDASRDSWVPASGVVAWPRPPRDLTPDNAWISFLSMPQP